MSHVKHWLRFMGAVIRTSPFTASLLALVTLLQGIRPAAEFWAVQRLIDYIVTHAGPGFLWGPAARWAAVLVFLALVGEGARQVLPYLTERLRQDAEVVLEGQLLEKAGRAPLLAMESSAYFDRFTRARDGLRRNIFDMLEQTLGIVMQVLVVASVLSVLAATHWAAALVIAAAAVPAWFLRKRSAEIALKLWMEQTEPQRRADYFYELMTQRKAAQEVRLFGLGPEFFRRWAKDAYGSLAERLRTSNRAVTLDGSANLLVTIAYCASVAILAFLAVAGRFSVGGLAASLKAAQDVQEALGQMVWQFANLRRSSLFVAQFWEFMDDTTSSPVGEAAPGVTATGVTATGVTAPRATAPESGVPGSSAAASQAPAAAEVICRDLTFAYPGNQRPALAEISFHVAPGELIALVGENGAGKSTLVKLLMGLYPPTAGALTVGGIDPYGTEGAEVRSHIAPVFQDFNRYSLTAGENIGVGEVARAGDRAAIEAAAAGSGADQVVAGLPRAYDTILGKEWEGGEELSGGQWQKLAIARGYMRRANLLVLDEPTAALDPMAELEVFRRFRQLVAGRTGFLISHRLGAARLADRIFVMKEGRLAEAGTHEALMALDGEYAALFRAQAEWYQ